MIPTDQEQSYNVFIPFNLKPIGGQKCTREKNQNVCLICQIGIKVDNF